MNMRIRSIQTTVLHSPEFNITVGKIYDVISLQVNDNFTRALILDDTDQLYTT